MGKIVLKSRIENDKFTEFIYSSYDIQNKDETITEIPFPSDDDIKSMKDDNWNIFLILGKSGGGKSTILRHLARITPIEYDYNKAVISQFQDLSEEEACDLLCGIGLSSVPTWLRKPQELSNGERARLDVAKAIYDHRDGSTITLDEYTSVVNRAAAKSMSFALQRYAREHNLKVIIASCHYDLIEWLQPDYVFNLNHADDNDEVEIEKMVYIDDKEYNVNQSIRENDALTERLEVRL